MGMEQKRELSSVDIAALAGELQAYRDSVVEKTYLYPDDSLRIKMRDYDLGRIELLAGVRDLKFVYVASPSHVPDAPERPPNFAKMLRNRIGGSNLVSVAQYEFDRILTFEFSRDGTSTYVIIEMFGDGNVVVCNEDMQVISCLDTVRLRSRTVAPGSTYEYPSSRFNPFTTSFDAFVTAMDDSDSDVVRTLATQLNLGGRYAEELCYRADIPKTTPIEDADSTQYEALFQSLTTLRENITTGNLEPTIYTKDDDTVVDVTPLPIHEYQATELAATQCETFTEALDTYFYRLQTEADRAESRVERPDFEAEIEKHQRILQQQEAAIADFESQAATEQEKAELLYANYDTVDDILSTVREAREEGLSWDTIEERFEEGKEAGISEAERVDGVDAAEGLIQIRLDSQSIAVDPSMGVEKNADRLYTESKAIKEKKEGAEAAIESTRADLAAIKKRRDEWESEPEPDVSREKPRDYLTMGSIPVRYDEQWYERFRWFRTSDGFLVLGGRNADQNEELVKKYMDPSDRFFHTQAAGAPVTILKATAPDEAARDVHIPDSSKSEAAKFGLSYSSVWKAGIYSGDVYEVSPDQVSKTPESGEYIEKGSFVIRGDRTYYRDITVGVAIGIMCTPETRVIGGPPAAIEPVAETSIRLEPGQYAQADIAKRLYRAFQDRFTDTSFIRKIASPDKIQEFCPPGGSRIVE